MPVTPFHFGPGALLHAVAPRQISFLAFAASNVVMDLESFFNLVYQRQPVHALLHTLLGATLVIIVVVGIFLAFRGWAIREDAPDWFGWKQLPAGAVLLGAFFGAYSHLLLDGLMHADMAPFWPFSVENPLLGAVPLVPLHLACIASGLTGLLILAVRWVVRRMA